MSGARARAVFFDLDGTLLDTWPLVYRSFVHAASRFLPQIPDELRCLKLFGLPLRQQMQILAPGALGQTIEAMVRAYREFNRANHPGWVHAFPGVAGTLRELRRRGLLLGVVTSKNRATTQLGLEVSGLQGLLDLVVAEEDTERHKPWPDPILAALRRAGVQASQALYVGDSPYDLQCARAAGVRAVACGWSLFGPQILRDARPDGFLSCPQELLTWFP